MVDAAIRPGGGEIGRRCAWFDVAERLGDRRTAAKNDSGQSRNPEEGPGSGRHFAQSDQGYWDLVWVMFAAATFSGLAGASAAVGAGLASDADEC